MNKKMKQEELCDTNDVAGIKNQMKDLVSIYQQVAYLSPNNDPSMDNLAGLSPL